MDQLAGIFAQLGGDATIIHQFVIFLILFVVLKMVFFNKLQFVIEMRENKTTKLEDHANHKFQEAEKLSSDYNQRVQTVTAQATEQFNKVKNEALTAQKEKVSSAQASADAQADEERKKFEAVLASKREAVLNNAKNLSDELVQKIIN